MNRYEMIFDAIQEKVNSGELSLEKANEVNDLAYDKYVTESSYESPSSGVSVSGVNITMNLREDSDK